MAEPALVVELEGGQALKLERQGSCYDLMRTQAGWARWELALVKR